MALQGKVRFLSVASSSTWTDVRVAADTDAVVGFRTIAFPGWRAYVDGREVTPGTAPRDPETGISPGFITVAVPAGDHRVQIAFGPTRMRTVRPWRASSRGVALWWLLLRGRAQPSRRRVALTWAPVALLALACAHDAVRPVVRPPARPTVADARLQADLISLAREGRGQISSPSGGSLGPYVNVQQVDIAGRERSWLYMHPPASFGYELDLPEGAAFQAGLGVDPRVWDAPGGDGLRFVLEVTPLSGVDQGQTVRVLDEPLNPHAFAGERRWHDRLVDLSAFGGSARQAHATD